MDGTGLRLGVTTMEVGARDDGGGLAEGEGEGVMEGVGDGLGVGEAGGEVGGMVGVVKLNSIGSELSEEAALQAVWVKRWALS